MLMTQQRGPQNRKLLVGLQTTEALLGLQHGGCCPSQSHPCITPTFDVAANLPQHRAGWGIIALPLVLLVYPPGFLWGMNPPVFPFICWQHPPSPYDGLHPYVFMIVAIYYAWAILMIRGAKDPGANAALFDFGILANLLHLGS